MTRPIVRVWIQGNCYAGSIRAMLAGYDKIKFRPSKDIFTSDMILYTGGADVSPRLYGEGVLTCTHYNPVQDQSDIDCFRVGLRMGKMQVGICRGAQFLNVMNNGKLWQNINNHAGQEHLVEDYETKETFIVSSLHHQGIILGKGATFLAGCNEATEKTSHGKFWKADMGISTDVEAYWYKETKCLGVQWHPECGPKDCVDWFFKYIERFREEDSLARPYGTGARAS